ncbi:MAG: hypothetical protein F4X76_11890 [Chloroflexi bacterium]|nr:hypothetical protein [Chloroflexota bacterium]
MSSEAVLQPQPEGIPLPYPTPVSEPHWEGCKRGELMVQRCVECEGYVFIPQPACTFCLSEELEWVRSSGKGTVYSWTTVYRPQQPSFETPYISAIIEVEEGWYMMTNLIDMSVDDVRIGLPVEVVFHAINDEITLPYFRPAG